MTLLPSNPLLAARPRVHPRPPHPTTPGRRQTSSCRHRSRFHSSSMLTLLRPPFSRTRGQTNSFHKTALIRGGRIPPTGAAPARTISEFITINKEDTRKAHSTRSLAESAKMTLSSIITHMSHLPSIISQLCLRYLLLRSRISGPLTSHRIPAGAERSRWMILICI